jgi:ATP phosphoribosyltransferase
MGLRAIETEPARRGLRLALPKGRMQAGIERLLADAGLPVRGSSRGYRPSIPLAGATAKLLKPKNVVPMLAAGTRDVGFAGVDLVQELGAAADLVELLDTGLDPVRIVAAAPPALLVDERLPRRPLVVATEYEQLTRRWLAERGLNGTVLRTFGATEVFPPEDADCIVDNTATGATLAAQGLVVVDELLTSTTRLYASRAAWADEERRGQLEDLALLLGAVLEARRRAILEVNVAADRLDAVVAALPCMREPTVAPLFGGAGFAVKAAVPRPQLPTLIPALKAVGATDILVTSPDGIVP